MSKLTKIAHAVSVALLAALVLGATGVGFAQSWAGLYAWAVERGLTGWKAASFPGMVDVFIAAGEVGLFILTLEGHRLTRKALSWIDILLPAAAAVSGWGVSLAFNVGHVHGDLSAKLTAAVAPIASCVGLLLLLRTLHRWVTSHPEEVAEPALEVAAVELPAIEGPAVATVACGHDPDHLEKLAARAVPAAQDPVEYLQFAAGVAKHDGHSQRQIATAWGVSRDKIRKLLNLTATDTDLSQDPDPVDDLGDDAVALVTDPELVTQ